MVHVIVVILIIVVVAIDIAQGSYRWDKRRCIAWKIGSYRWDRRRCLRGTIQDGRRCRPGVNLSADILAGWRILKVTSETEIEVADMSACCEVQGLQDDKRHQERLH
jgi:hypothetical protein